jgi:hypothetical protein
MFTVPARAGGVGLGSRRRVGFYDPVSLGAHEGPIILAVADHRRGLGRSKLKSFPTTLHYHRGVLKNQE